MKITEIQNAFTKKRFRLHIQIGLLPIISIVTVYEPDPKEWIDNKIRRK